MKAHASKVQCAALWMFWLVSCSQGMDSDPFAVRLTIEEDIVSGHAVFLFELTEAGRSLLDKRLVDEVGEGVLLSYYWRDASSWNSWRARDYWRVDVCRPDGTAVRTLTYDGISINTGDTIWDAEYLTDYLSDPSQDEFVALKWPYHVVAEQALFPLSLGRLWDVKNWHTAFQFVYPSEPCPELEPGHVAVEYRPNTMRVLFFPDGSESEEEKKMMASSQASQDKEEELSKSAARRIVLDRAHSFMPVSWGSASRGSLREDAQGAKAHKYVWDQPVEVCPGVFFPRRCRTYIDDENGTLLSTSELLVEQSSFKSRISNRE